MNANGTFYYKDWSLSQQHHAIWQAITYMISQTNKTEADKNNAIYQRRADLAAQRKAGTDTDSANPSSFVLKPGPSSGPGLTNPAQRKRLANTETAGYEEGLHKRVKIEDSNEASSNLTVDVNPAGSTSEDPLVISDVGPEDEGHLQEAVTGDEVAVEANQLESGVETDTEREAIAADVGGRTFDLSIRHR